MNSEKIFPILLFISKTPSSVEISFGDWIIGVQSTFEQHITSLPALAKPRKRTRKSTGGSSSPDASTEDNQSDEDVSQDSRRNSFWNMNIFRRVEQSLVQPLAQKFRMAAPKATSFGEHPLLSRTNLEMMKLFAQRVKTVFIY